MIQLKIKKLKSVIAKNPNVEINNITTSVCANDARKELCTNHFDLFITDLLIPLEFGDNPSSDECISLLHDIVNDDFIKKPSYIIGLSAYKDEILQYESYFLSEDCNLLSYDEMENNWEISLNQRIDYIFKSKNNDLGNIEEYKYDIGIICALNEPEFLHIKKLSNDWKLIKDKSTPIQFYETYFVRDNKN